MDVGTKAADHYASHMARPRFWCREQLVWIIRLETPILARIQSAVRNPWLDWYFAMSANIGTHTFYMVMLPITFWYGDPKFGLDIVLVLAIGVFTTGFLKDFLCLPRPMSPPLHRISMSGSAMLEYGMPSTHSCNAVSVVMVLADTFPNNQIVYWASIWLLVTLVSGRLYNGMHGFLDIIVGCFFGIGSYALREYIRQNFNLYSCFDNTSFTLLTVLAISACPSPVDDCPCFDDSVAFAGVVLGILWTLYFGQSPYAYFDATTFTNWVAVFAFGILRFFVGVIFIVLWRHFAKRLLLRILPPIYRVLSQWGIQNPRRYFVTANEYSKVPGNLPTDGIPDSRPEVVEMVTKLRKLNRSPSVSTGPQSEADLYELRAHDKKNIANTINLPRQHYDVEVVMRLIVYGGIAPIALLLAPFFFHLLHI